MDLDNKSTLRIFIIVSAIYSALRILSYSISFVQSYFNIDNPLIPDYLTYYIAFPLYFFIPIFSFILWYCIRSLKSKDYNKKITFMIFGFVIVFYFFEVHIYKFIQEFNPYG